MKRNSFEVLLKTNIAVRYFDSTAIFLYINFVFVMVLQWRKKIEEKEQQRTWKRNAFGKHLRNEWSSTTTECRPNVASLFFINIFKNHCRLFRFFCFLPFWSDSLICLYSMRIERTCSSILYTVHPWTKTASH